MLLWPGGLLAVLSVPVVTSVPAPLPIISIPHQAGLDCNQDYHLLWLPDRSGRKTEQCAERRGESSRGFGVDRTAGYRFEQRRSGDRTVHSPSPPKRSQPKCPRLRYRSERVSLLTSWAFRKLYPDVMVVQPRHDWDGYNDPGPLDCPT